MNFRQTLLELESQRDLIVAAIASLKAIGNGQVDGGSMTVLGAAIAHIKKAGKPQTTRQLRQAVYDAGVKATRGSIQTMLGKQARLKKDLIKKSRGLWTLKH